MASTRPVRTVSNYICRVCRAKAPSTSTRFFSTTQRRPADDDMVNDLFKNAHSVQKPAPPTSTRSEILDQDPQQYPEFQSMLDTESFDSFNQPRGPHRMHVFATKHNTHITLVQPARPASETASLRIAGAKTSATEQKKTIDTMLSLSAGNIGFKKAGRGSYDAGFQLAAFVLRQMGEKGMTNEISKLEVVLRGFGAGREAVTKALLGTEGRFVRNKISAVVDATRLKQGGPRSKKPRRLG